MCILCFRLGDVTVALWNMRARLWSAAQNYFIITYFNTHGRTLYYCVLYRRRYYCNIIDVVKQQISTVIYIRNIIYRCSSTAVIFVRRPNSVPCVRDIIINIIQAHYNIICIYIKWWAQVLITPHKKKITLSFDIDAAMVGSIYGTRIAGLSPRVTIKI